MQAVTTAIGAARRAIEALTVALIAVLLAVMGLQIVFRYVFNDSLIWAEELCRYLLIWVSFLACYAAYERGEIAAVTLFRDMLPRRAALAVAILCNLLGIALLAVIVWYGLIYAGRIGGQPVPAFGFLLDDLFGTGDLAPSFYWVYLGLPVGMALLALRMAVETAIIARGLGARGETER